MSHYLGRESDISRRAVCLMITADNTKDNTENTSSLDMICFVCLCQFLLIDMRGRGTVNLHIWPIWHQMWNTERSQSQKECTGLCLLFPAVITSAAVICMAHKLHAMRSLPWQTFVLPKELNVGKTQRVGYRTEDTQQ